MVAMRGEDALVTRLRDTVSGRVHAGEPMAPHTTLRVGGPAAAFVVAETPGDLTAVSAACTDLGRDWLILGRGSNLLVADEGWPGAVVTLGRGFRGLDVDGNAVVAGAAEPMPVLATAVARHALGGLAFGVAIPGSLGGAVRMNAGAMGREVADVLEWAEAVRLADGGRLQRFPAAELALSYRHSDLPDDAVVVRARLALAHVPEEELAAEMATFKQWRRDHQPVNQPSCGSVFRNPPGDSAGRLVEAAGMKGHRVGRAAVSPKHANFITVEPGAAAAEVFRVLRDVQEAVERTAGIRLEPEVVLAGFTVGTGA
jgi:UDP-N-acetylmuramate dehydrogenase